jgi:dTDP-glucose 4,6-dehydratase
LNILITGGSGFIGSNFLNMHVGKHKEHLFINFDKLTYAANPLNLESISTLPNYRFEQGDLVDKTSLETLFIKYQPDLIFHFAAESHVDRSILGPAEFIQSNIIGTFNLLEACRTNWPAGSNKLFIHVSTDEVYGSLGDTGYFTETTAYDPSSPYSASKASADHLVRAYHRTYGLAAIITNCSNNFGPYQFPEKLIPLMIINALENKPLPVYGKGENIRDWLYVEDHCRALWTIAQKGKPGENYNIGGNSEMKNIDLVNNICEIMAEELGQEESALKNLITFVKDRPGHDLRYAIDSGKLKAELGWSPAEDLKTGLRKTVKWYLANPGWISNVQSGAYQTWLNTNYGGRSL